MELQDLDHHPSCGAAYGLLGCVSPPRPVTSLLITLSPAVGIWSIWTEAQTGIQEIGVILADVTIRVRYFFILTFVLNLLCSGGYFEYKYKLFQCSCLPFIRPHLLEDLARDVADVAAHRGRQLNGTNHVHRHRVWSVTVVRFIVACAYAIDG